jgi:hypothetical protein
MLAIFETVFKISFLLSWLNLMFCFVIHAVFIRPVALKLRNKKGILPRTLWLNVEGMADYWDVEEHAKATNDLKILKRIRILKYSMISTVILIVIAFGSGLVFWVVRMAAEHSTL